MRAFLQRLAALAVIAGSVLVSMPHQARADDPTQFAILKAGTQDLPEVWLNGEVKIRLNTTAADPKKLQLWLDGSQLGVEPRVLGKDEFLFPLSRTNDNRDLWSRLLGSPLSDQRRTVAVGVQYDKKPLDWSKPPKADEATSAKVMLITYNGGLMALGIVAALAAILVISFTAATTALIRDGIAGPPMRHQDRPFSLGRLQMLVWTCLIFSSFVFILIVTWDFGSLNAESFILMGISASTALAAVAIDRSKDSGVTAVQTSVQQLGITTLDDVSKLYAGAAATKARPTIPAATIPAAGGTAANADPTFGELRAAYEAVIAKIKSKSFLEDLVNDAEGPTIHRWQILIWTIVLGAIYFGKVYTNLEMPTFGTNLLALMGISGGTYLGFKIPEKQ